MVCGHEDLYYALAGLSLDLKTLSVLSFFTENKYFCVVMAGYRQRVDLNQILHLDNVIIYYLGQILIHFTSRDFEYLLVGCFGNLVPHYRSKILRIQGAIAPFDTRLPKQL
ncbi:hypothetical protein ACJX0J_012405, partial [Zea mays]